MKMFRIELSDDVVNEDGNIGFEGNITIRNFKESFFSENVFFDKISYYKQWKKAIYKLKKENYTYFLTSINEPNSSNYYMGWTAYMRDDRIFIQNKIFLSHQISLTKLLEMTAILPKFCTTTEDGEDISTWETNMQEMNEYKIFLEQYLYTQQRI